MKQTNIIVMIPNGVQPFKFFNIENLKIDVDANGNNILSFEFEPETGSYSTAHFMYVAYILESIDLEKAAAEDALDNVVAIR